VVLIRCPFTGDLTKAAVQSQSRFVALRFHYGLQTRFASVPDVHYGEDRHFATETMGVSEWTLTGTLAGGKKLRVRGCDHYEFADGKVIRKDSYWKIVE
jgi:hypothetical protein